MAVYTCSEEGVRILCKLVDEIRDRMDMISIETDSISSAIEEHGELLGPHYKSLVKSIEQIKNAIRQSTIPIVEVSDKLSLVARKYQDIIADDPFCVELIDGINSYKMTNGKGMAIEGSARSVEIEAFKRDIIGLQSTMDLSDGEQGIVQLSGIHDFVRNNDGTGYESHHIPSAAVLKEFGIDTNQWPTIALRKEDHELTDSYKGKQRKVLRSEIDPQNAMGTYKEESINMIASSGGLFQLVRDEIYNIKDACGDRYDGAIKQFFQQISSYIEKNGIPHKE